MACAIYNTIFRDLAPCDRFNHDLRAPSFFKLPDHFCQVITLEIRGDIIQQYIWQDNRKSIITNQRIRT